MKTTLFALIAAVSSNAAAAAAALPTLTVKAPRGPGTEFFRAAEPSLPAHAGIEVKNEAQKTPWTVDATVLDKPAERAAIAAGKYTTTIYRHLTAAEKAAGLAETVLGYYGAVLVTSPAAPVDGIDRNKWKAYLSAKSEPALKWSTIANVPAGKDAPLTWSLPSSEHKRWPQPFIFAHAFPERLVAQFAKGTTDPEDATYAVGQKKDAIALHGFDFVLNRDNNYMNPLKVLKVDGVEPTILTLGNESYPLARTIVFVYGAAAARDAASPVAKLIAWLPSPNGIGVARERQLVLPVPPKPAAAH
jgi:hypothetical protein